jgi:transcriptional regulator with XRE-family HTH domain
VEGDLQRIVGENIRAHREAIGESQEAFAAAFGVHRTYIGAVERGKKNLSLRTVENYAARLGLDAMDLLTPPDG